MRGILDFAWLLHKDSSIHLRSTQDEPLQIKIAKKLRPKIEGLKRPKYGPFWGADIKVECRLVLKTMCKGRAPFGARMPFRRDGRRSYNAFPKITHTR
jgi:hypothetical protein